MEPSPTPAWYIFDGTDSDRSGPELNLDRLRKLPAPPPWRRFDNLDRERAQSFRPEPEHIAKVNAALYLRRPLLVTGRPGTGKTSLVYAVARELGLGAVLRWSITSRSTLQEGQYQYDAIGRLQETRLDRSDDTAPDDAGAASAPTPKPRRDIGAYLTLGPLGTTFCARSDPDGSRYYPRVLLIDEIDKSDIDLPNDLLHVFEEGRFEIPELVRLKESQNPVKVRGWGRDAELITLRDGEVPCREFPLVVMTSNGEREFPPAFLRRCLPLHMQPPGREKLEAIVRAHLFPVPSGAHARERQDIEMQFQAAKGEIDELIRVFLARRGKQGQELLATDQLLNAICLTMSGVDLGPLTEAYGGLGCDGLLDTLFQPLSGD